MSPEVLAHATKQYLAALKHQVEVAQAFYAGRLTEGMEGLLSLPEEIRLRIDQLLWEASSGEGIDIREKESQGVIAAAIMHSLEERMGFYDDPDNDK